MPRTPAVSQLGSSFVIDVLERRPLLPDQSLTHPQKFPCRSRPALMSDYVTTSTDNDRSPRHPNWSEPRASSGSLVSRKRDQ
jgi:hypothetical protein